jgi:NitT/TauT family transport system substrate-binding protein
MTSTSPVCALPSLPGRVDHRRRVLLAGVAGASVLGLGALSTRVFSRVEAPFSQSAGALNHITHQLGWLKGVQFAGNFVAEDRGFLKQEHLTAQFTAGGPGTDYRTLVASGRMLVSESNVAGMIESHLQGQPLVAFASVMQRDPGCLLSAADRPVRSLHEMVGKTIGAPNNVRAQIVALLRRAGIDPSSVKIVPVGSDPSLLAARQVDAYYSWATTALPALRRAHFDAHVLHMDEIGVPGYGQVLIARRDMLEAHHDTFVRYTRALVKGWSLMVQDPVGTAQMVVRKYALPGTSLDEQIEQARAMLPYIWTGDALRQGMLWINPQVFEQGLVLAREAGSVPAGADFDMSKIVTQSVIKAALSA